MPSNFLVRVHRILPLISLLALLSACGGGGGGGGGSAPAPAAAGAGTGPGTSSTTNSIVPAVPSNNASFAQCPTTPAPNTGMPSTTAALKGRVTFDRIPFLAAPSGPWMTGPGLDYANPVVTPARGIVVEAVAATSGTCEGNVLDTTVTDGDGWYGLNVSLDQTVCVRARAQLFRSDSVGASWNFSVVDNTSSNQMYAMADSRFASARNLPRRDMHAGSGWSGGYTGTRVAPPFAILDTACKAMDAILNVQPGAQFGTMTFRWSELNTESSSGALTAGHIGGAFYSSAAQAVYLRGDKTTNTDEFDEMVIAHEFGHFVTDRFARSDSISGDHSLLDKLDPRLAFDEGWASAFAGLVLNTRVYRDSDEVSSAQRPSREYYFFLDDMTFLEPAWYTEGSIQNLIYSFGESTNSDGVALGFAPIWQTLINSGRSEPALHTIFSFASALKAANPGDAGGIAALLNGQNISGDTIENFAATETHAPDTTRDLPIYKTLTTAAISNVCSRNLYTQSPYSATDGANKLSIIRYLRFDAPSTGNFKITATPLRTDSVKGGLAGLHIYQQGRDIACSSGNSNIESLVPGSAVHLTCPMAAGPYVVAVYQTDFSNDPNAASGNYDQCFAVKAEAQ